MSELDIDTVTRHLEGVMAKEPREASSAGSRKRAWYTLDVALLAGFVLTYAAFLSVLHVMAYLLGLQRKPSLAFGAVLVGLVLLTLTLLLVSVSRMGGGWREHLPDKGRLLRLRLLTIFGIAAYLILPFTRLGLPPHKTFTRAFRQYILVNVDLDALRAWLSTVDPKKCSDYVYDLTSGATIEEWWPDAAPWAKTVTPLEPHSAMLLPDSGGHPAIGIRWLGLFNGWGLVVGRKNMQTAPSGFSLYSEYRLPLDSGAYVWHERGGAWRAFRWWINGPRRA
jgi:hypothetical protein